MKLARRMGAIGDSKTLAITAEAKRLKAQGLDVIGFGAGEPDFDTPDHIKEAAVKALKEGFTKYTPAAGIPELREAIAEKFQRDNGLSYSPEEVIVSHGAKFAIYCAFQVLCDEGDEVIIPIPYWVSYPEQVKAAGGEPVFIPSSPDSFKLDLQSLRKAITRKTKLLILNSPSNPSGVVYTKDELEKIAEIALEKEILILSDEVYEKIIYDGLKHISIASVGEEVKKKTLVVNAVSKTYSMTGWRIGYAAGPKEVISAIGILQSQSISNPNSIAQKASLAALKGPQKPVEDMLKEFDQRRRMMGSLMNQLLPHPIPLPQGAFYIFVDMSPYLSAEMPTADELTAYLLKEALVAVVPGTSFGSPNHIRLSYATSRHCIEEGLRRMKESLSKVASR